MANEGRLSRAVSEVPGELWVSIFAGLGADEDRKRCRLVCARWSRALDCAAAWRMGSDECEALWWAVCRRGRLGAARWARRAFNPTRAWAVHALVSTPLEATRWLVASFEITRDDVLAQVNSEGDEQDSILSCAWNTGDDPGVARWLVEEFKISAAEARKDALDLGNEISDERVDRAQLLVEMFRLASSDVREQLPVIVACLENVSYDDAPLLVWLSEFELIERSESVSAREVLRRARKGGKSKIVSWLLRRPEIANLREVVRRACEERKINVVRWLLKRTWGQSRRLAARLEEPRFREN
jgi:hypothetical protein